MAPRGRTKHARVVPSRGGPPRPPREGRSPTRAASISSATSTRPAGYPTNCRTSRRQIAKPARRTSRRPRACWPPASPRGSTPTARPVGLRLRPRRPESSMAGGEGRLRPRAAEDGEAAEGSASIVQAGPGSSSGSITPVRGAPLPGGSDPGCCTDRSGGAYGALPSAASIALTVWSPMLGRKWE